MTRFEFRDLLTRIENHDMQVGAPVSVKMCDVTQPKFQDHPQLEATSGREPDSR